MTDKELTELTPIQAIRYITGIVRPEHAVDIIALVNFICRYVEGEAEESYFHQVMKNIGIKIV